MELENLGTPRQFVSAENPWSETKHPEDMHHQFNLKFVYRANVTLDDWFCTEVSKLTDFIDTAKMTGPSSETDSELPRQNFQLLKQDDHSHRHDNALELKNNSETGLLTSYDEQISVASSSSSEDETKDADIIANNIASSDLHEFPSGERKWHLQVKTEAILEKSECQLQDISDINGIRIKKGDFKFYEQSMYKLDVDEKHTPLGKVDQYKSIKIPLNIRNHMLKKNMLHGMKRYRLQELLSSCHGKELEKDPPMKDPTIDYVVCARKALQMPQRKCTASDKKSVSKISQSKLEIVPRKEGRNFLDSKDFIAKAELSLQYEPAKQLLRYSKKKNNCKFTRGSANDFGNQEIALNRQLMSLSMKIETMDNANRSSLNLKKGNLETILMNYTRIYHSPIFEALEENLEKGTSCRKILDLSDKNVHQKECIFNDFRAQSSMQDFKIVVSDSEAQLLNGVLQTEKKVKICPEDEDKGQKEDVLHNEVEARTFTSSFEEKKKIKELEQLLQKMINEENTTLAFNKSLKRELQAARMDAEEFRQYVSDYINKNENLLVLAQTKEAELNNLAKLSGGLNKTLCLTTQVNDYLTRSLHVICNQIGYLKHQHYVLKQRYVLTVLKLRCMKANIVNHEKSLENLTRRIEAIGKNQKMLLSGIDKLKAPLQAAEHQQVQLEADLMHSQNVIDDLREKISVKENEMFRLKATMEEALAQSTMLKQTSESKEQEILLLQSKKAVLLQELQRLLKEDMEKDHDIAVLKEELAYAYGKAQ